MSYNPSKLTPLDLSPNFAVSAYAPKLKVSLTFPENSPFTKQEFKDECDINILLARYQSTGEIPNINERAPQYLDVTGHDYQEHMNVIAGAQTLFNELPSSLRNRFENDPALFLDFTSNPDNVPEMQKLGLLKPVDEWVNVPPSFNNQMPPVANPVLSTPSSIIPPAP